MKFEKTSHLQGTITVPGDKSISHRAVMFGALAKGTTTITNFLQGADCLATIDCFRKMGIEIENDGETVHVHGKGLRGLTAPKDTLYTGNSGTTTRLIAGILSGQPFATTLSGDESLNSRPMERIMKPLSKMGADIKSVLDNNCAPLKITPASLHGAHYESPVASAQVKSACLLAGLYADSETSVTEPTLSRNHTELMLSSFGADITSSIHETTGKATACIKPCSELYAKDILVPGDISSAAYFIAAGLLIPNSKILIQNVGINPTRAGILKVCEDMGADITYLNKKEDGEPTADILVRTSKLHGVTIQGSIIPTLIDEIPIIAIMAAHAEGETIIRDAAELKVKETDRIHTITENLTKMGGNIVPTNDGMIIQGGSSLHGAHINSYLDHRIAMAFAIAGLTADGTTTIEGEECVDVSYPEFYETLDGLMPVRIPRSVL